MKQSSCITNFYDAYAPGDLFIGKDKTNNRYVTYLILRLGNGKELYTFLVNQPGFGLQLYKDETVAFSNYSWVQLRRNVT